MNPLSDLRNVLRYEPDTGHFYWLVSPSSLVKIGDRAGSVKRGGYIGIKFDGKIYFAHRLAWLFTNGAWPTGSLDHRNRNPADNRITNLRECSASQNQANRSLNKNNSTGYRGVDRRGKRYRASIKVGFHSIYLGTFESAAAASGAYENAAIALFGEFSAILSSHSAFPRAA